MSDPLLEIDDLTIKYGTKDGELTAVSDASFVLGHGEYFGLVGESGCGKSTIAKAIVGGLDDNGWVDSGKIRYRGEEIQGMDEAALNESIRWKEISLIPQSSMNSLDPLQRIVEKAVELAQVHTDMSDAAAREKLRDLFSTVGIDESRVTDYPHQFSGGMQQRAIIALALLLDPKLVVADEPTTALDVIMQDQVFRYLEEIKESNTSMLLITHDISSVFEACSKMAIMHAGQIAETGPVTEVFDNPRHPYSILLQEAFPDVRKPNKPLEVIGGNPPQVMGEADYCTFADRCPWAVSACTDAAPPLVPAETGTADHKVACIRSDEVHELYEADGSEQAEPSSTPAAADGTTGGDR